MTKYVATQDDTGLWGVEDLGGALLYESTFEHVSVAQYVAKRHSENDDLEWDDIADEVAELEAQLAQHPAPATAPAGAVGDVLAWQAAHDDLAFYEATKDADLDDRDYWWKATGQHWPAGKEPAPRTDLKPDTLKVWPIMFRNSALTGAYDCDGDVGSKLDMLDARDVIATLQAELAETRQRLAAVAGALHAIIVNAEAALVDLGGVHEDAMPADKRVLFRVFRIADGALQAAQASEGGG